MLNNLSIRKKLALVALGPLLLLLALSALRIMDDLGDSSDATDTQARVTTSALTGQLFDAVRAEAVENQNAVAISGHDLDAVRADTDAVIDRWTDSVGEFSGVDGGSLASTVQDFNAHRAEVAAQFATESGASTVFDADVEILRTIAVFDGLVSSGALTDARDLRQAADLTTVSATAAELQLLGTWATNAEVVPSKLPAAIGASMNAADTYGVRNGTELPDNEVSYEQLVTELAALRVEDPVEISPNDWRAASDARALQLSNARAAEVVAASTSAADAQNAAQGAMRTAGLLALIGLVLAVGAIVFVGKTFVESLRVLRDEAAQLADNDLPRLAQSLSSGEPVEDLRNERDVDALGSDEFGDVAVGLGAIRQSAADLGDRVASLQGGIADTFVNLARRNQSLVDRQLEAIDTLEAEERDSDRLSLMYRVDHLATRMRRNAESLLVLADAKTPERHSPAVELREVLRVAIGEVEDYRRVIPIALDDLRVAGHRAQDLAHLLAELMENAAQHSPPGTAVDVAGSVDRASGDYAITILDHGTGIDAQQRADLNAVLESRPTSTLTISHSIGLQVVRRLAHSLGLRVHLDDADGGGIEAKVIVPAKVVAEWAQTTPGGVAPAQPAPTAPPAAAPIASDVPDVPQEAVVPTAPAPTELVAPVVAAAPVEPAPYPPQPEAPIVPVHIPEVEQPHMDVAEPMNLAGLDSLMSSDAVEVPAAPAVPTIEMPELDLPSFGEAPVLEPEVAVEASGNVAPDAEPAPVEFDQAPPEVFEPASPFAETSAGMEFTDVEPFPNADVFTDDDTPSLTPEPPVFDTLPTPPTAAPSIVPPPVVPEPVPKPPVVSAPLPVAEVAPPQVAPPQVVSTPVAPPVSAPTPMPVAESVAPVPEVTAAGLVRRQRQEVDTQPKVDLEADRTAPSQRTPDQVKNMLSRYKTGLERGRGATGTGGE